MREKDSRRRGAFAKQQGGGEATAVRSFTRTSRILKRRGKAHGRLHKPYASKTLSGLFVKTTVSELKKAGMREEREEGRQLFAEEEVDAYVPGFMKETEEKAGGTARGNAYHRFMELFAFGQKGAGENWSVPEIRTLLKAKAESGELTVSEAEAINPYKIRAFLESGLAARMAEADRKKKLVREQPFVLGIPASSMDSAFPEEETVLIQGIIDVFLRKTFVLMDYRRPGIRCRRAYAEVPGTARTL
ncbi:MAG: hypothetical protein ACLR9I_09975 [Eisenbergiella sp.]